MIGIIDTGINNLGSIYNCLDFLSLPYGVIKNKSDLLSYDNYILPGVGSYDAGVEALQETGLYDAIKELDFTQKKILGICLGMQFLATEGFENSRSKGLNFIDATVNLMDNDELNNYNLPHVGWNEINILKNHKIFDGLKNNSNFYFVHSYQIILKNSDNLFAETKYLSNFPSIIINDNVFGFQFHPEKSSKNGLKILENFCNWSE